MTCNLCGSDLGDGTVTITGEIDREKERDRPTTFYVELCEGCDDWIAEGLFEGERAERPLQAD